MEYINVSQFYESVLCFSLPLLLIQRVILVFSDLSSKYEDYRRTFYEQQFKFTKQYEYRVEQLPQEISNRDQMLEKPDDAQSVRIQNSVHMEERNQAEIQPTKAKQQPSEKQTIENKAEIDSIKRKSSENIESKQLKRVNKIDIDLQTDRELKNSKSQANVNRRIQPDSPRIIKSKTLNQKQQIQSQSEPDSAKAKEKDDNQSAKKDNLQQNARRSSVKVQGKQIMHEIQQSRMSKVTQSDYEVRRQTEFDRDSFGLGPVDGQTDVKTVDKQKVIIELGTGQLLEKGEKDRIRMKYCRRIDDAFNDYVPIILSVIVLGILTKSVYIYSMCCFFGYAFSSLLFNYIHLLDKLEGSGENKSFFGRANQLISSLFIIGLFISYWISDQFY